MKRHFRIFALALAIFSLTAIWSIVHNIMYTGGIEYAIQAAAKPTNKQIQQKLKDRGFYKGKVDGIIGTQTKTAIKSFQKANGLVVDGMVGPKTLAKLGLSGATVNNATVNASSLYLLAKCIHAEARGEPYVGQVAVGAVILNRVKNANFPNTIAGVVYQPRAFTAVDDGQINLEPNATSKRAAQDALNGWDPTNGCLYYYNPRTATSQWIFSRKTMTTIGRHRFAL